MKFFNYNLPYLILAIVSAGLLPARLEARNGQTAILPFYVTGRPDAMTFEPRELPVLLQEALHFYSSELKNISLQPLSETRSSMDRLGLESSQIINQQVSARICIETGASWFVAPYAYFSEKNRVEMGATVFSCSTRRESDRFKGFFSVNTIQKGLRSIVKETLPYAPDKSIVRSDSSSQPADVVVILDASGSMVQDIPSILEGLRSGFRELPPASRLGAVVLQPDNQQTIISLNRDWELQLEKLKTYRGAGEVSVQSVDRALAEAEAFRDWKGQKKIMIFTDADTAPARKTSLESRLRRLKARGIEIQFFHLLEQKPEDRAYWSSVSRRMNAQDPETVYGRRVGFLQGYSVYLIMKGDRFYRADREVGPAIQNGEEPVPLTPLDTIHYKAADRNLHRLPEEYARIHKLKVTGLSRIISGLENKVYRAAISGQSGAESVYMALIRSGENSFWIRLNSESAYRGIAARRGRRYYAGLSFLKSPGTERLPLNDPDRIIIREQNNVPALLINNYNHIMTLPADLIDPEDIWFLPAETEEVKHVRESRDIRE